MLDGRLTGWKTQGFLCVFSQFGSVFIKNLGISQYEMLKTFNCGVGFCIVVKKKNISKVKKIFSKNYQPYEIGLFEKGKKKIVTYGKINW